MSRTMPTECDHGAVIDWGDFGPADQRPEFCPEQCSAATQALWMWRARRAADFSEDDASKRDECVRLNHPVAGMDDGRWAPNSVARCYCGEYSRTVSFDELIHRSPLGTPAAEDARESVENSKLYGDGLAEGWDEAHALLCGFHAEGCWTHENPHQP